MSKSFACYRLPIHLPAKERISIAELAEEPFIMGRWESWKVHHRLIRDFCSAHGFVPQVIQEVEHAYGIMGLVTAALGVTLHANATWIHALEGISVRPLRERPPEAQTSAIWQKGRRSTSPSSRPLYSSDRDCCVGRGHQLRTRFQLPVIAWRDVGREGRGLTPDLCGHAQKILTENATHSAIGIALCNHRLSELGKLLGLKKASSCFCSCRSRERHAS